MTATTYNFDSWVEFILKIEKPYSDVRGDNGGKTYYGFTEATLRSLGEEPPMDAEAAKRLYFEHFWAHYNLYAMHWFVAWLYGDALVNHNPRSAAKCLQAGLGVAQDGYVGPITMERSGSPNNLSEVWRRYARRRNRLYFAIVRNHRAKSDKSVDDWMRDSQFKFLEGWMNRKDELLAAAYESNHSDPLGEYDIVL